MIICDGSGFSRCLCDLCEAQREELNSMVRENTDDRETDSPVATDGRGLVSRVNVYIMSLIEEVADETRLATDPMDHLAEKEKMAVLNKVVRFLHRTVAKDGWGVLVRLNTYIEALIEEGSKEEKIVLNKVVSFLHHELSHEQQVIANQLKRDLKQ